MSRRGWAVGGPFRSVSTLLPANSTIVRQFQAEFGLSFPLVRASGDHVPLGDDSFDLVISEYGAAIWADPYAWIPEASRLLRPGGELLFPGNSTLLMLCVPDEDDIVDPVFGNGG
jgi:SAM-dependent methyltransferase